MARVVVKLEMLDKLSKPADKAAGRMKRFGSEAKKAFNKASKSAKKFGDGLASFGKKVDGVLKKVINFRSAMVALAAIGIAKFTIGAAASMEVMAKQLEIVSESGEKAKQALAAIREFARTSPLETEDVVQSFVRLRAVGIDPTIEQMRTIGGVAVLFNREMVDVLDAFIGLNKRTLRKLGIEIDRTGAKAVIQSGNIKRVVEKDSTSIRNALLEIWEERFPNAIEDAADTTKAKLAIMKSNVFELSVAVGEKLLPAFNSVVEKIGEMAKGIKDAIDPIGRIGVIAKGETALTDLAIEREKVEKRIADIRAGRVGPNQLDMADKLMESEEKKLNAIIEQQKKLVGVISLQKVFDKQQERRKKERKAALVTVDPDAKKAAEQLAKDKFNAGKKALAEFRKFQLDDARATFEQRIDIEKAGEKVLKDIRDLALEDAKATFLKKKKLRDDDAREIANINDAIFNNSRALGESLTNLARQSVINSKRSAEKKKRILIGLAVADAASAAVSGIRAVWTDDSIKSSVAKLVLSLLVAGQIIASTAGQISSIKKASFAGGTMGAPGGMSLVGEQGPELAKLPTGSQIFTSNQTRQMVGGTTVNIPVTINGNASPATVGLLKDELSTVARRMEDAIRYGHLDLEKVGIQRA